MNIEEQFEQLTSCFSDTEIDANKDLIESFRSKLETAVRIIDEEFGDSDTKIEFEHKFYGSLKMRFKLWVYMSVGHVTACVQDTGKAFFDRGAVLLRDQSSYPEDGGKMVWKNASCPTSVMHAVKTGKGFVLAESDSLFILDANIQYSKLYNMWKVNSEVVIG